MEVQAGNPFRCVTVLICYLGINILVYQHSFTFPKPSPEARADKIICEPDWYNDPGPIHTRTQSVSAETAAYREVIERLPTDSTLILRGTG